MTTKPPSTSARSAWPEAARCYLELRVKTCHDINKLLAWLLQRAWPMPPVVLRICTPTSTLHLPLSRSPCLRNMSRAPRAFAKITKIRVPFLPAALGLSSRSCGYELVYGPAALKPFDATLTLDKAGERCWTCTDLPLETPGPKSWAYTPPLRIAIGGLSIESKHLPCHHPTC